MAKRFRITFDDGSTFETEAANGDLAKRQAKTDAQQRSNADTRTDPRVKVKSVEELTEQNR